MQLTSTPAVDGRTASILILDISSGHIRQHGGVIGSLKGFIRKILDFFWPPDPSDAPYNEAKTAYTQYHTSRQILDLDTALQNFQLALDLRQKNNHENLAATLINYAVALWAHYEQCDRPRDELKRVIKLYEEARNLWASVVPRPSSYPTLFTNLAQAYLDSYRLTKSANEFEQILVLNKELSEDTTLPEKLRNSALLEIGIARWTHCDLEKTTDQLDDGIQNLKTVLMYANANDDTVIRAKCLVNLGSAHQIRHREVGKQSSDDSDLLAAIQYNQDALKELAADDTLRGSCLYNLAILLGERYGVNREVADLQEAKGLALEAQGLVPSGELHDNIAKLFEELRRDSW
ncbi:hypothetical protein BDZ97DRAFT_624874 [Flammula alnicola]|nr:hypothetical protein BDZ97DRAFT_624874 [Flammula alnicola]